MSNRSFCPQCLRAQTACICHCIRPVISQIEIGILQHSSERAQSKGSARLAAMCLSSAKLWVGDEVVSAQIQFSSEVVCLQTWLEQSTTYLLYPATQEGFFSKMLPAGDVLRSHPKQDFQILVLDGTWRKTHKLLMENPILQNLPRIMIAPKQLSNYQIRKQKDSGSLSTIEAISQLLTELEPHNETVCNLGKSFGLMQEFWLSLRRPSM